jgi:hypothetical protein
MNWAQQSALSTSSVKASNFDYNENRSVIHLSCSCLFVSEILPLESDLKKAETVQTFSANECMPCFSTFSHDQQEARSLFSTSSELEDKAVIKGVLAERLAVIRAKSVMFWAVSESLASNKDAQSICPVRYDKRRAGVEKRAREMGRFISAQCPQPRKSINPK